MERRTKRRTKSRKEKGKENKPMRVLLRILLLALRKILDSTIFFAIVTGLLMIWWLDLFQAAARSSCIILVILLLGMAICVGWLMAFHLRQYPENKKMLFGAIGISLLLYAALFIRQLF